MSEILVRKMIPEDLGAVCEIEQENFSLPWSEKSFCDSMKRDDTVFLTALFDDRIAGYIGCYCIAGVGEITNVAVSAAMRRKGIAVRLLETLFTEGKKLETEEFFLEVRESNAGAIALYSHMGFVTEGVRKNFYEKPVENALIMWRHDPAINSL